MRTIKAASRSNNAHSSRISLPRASGSKPLHHGRSEEIHKNLKEKSAWYQAIRSPARGAGVKIPDDAGIETGTLQCCYETSFTTNAAGIGGVASKTLLPNMAATTRNVHFVSDTSTASTVVYDPAGADFPTNEALQSYTRAVRVVSAALYVEPEVSLAEARGELIVGFYPYGTMEGAHSPILSISDFQNAYGTAIIPLNSSTPMVTRWFPTSYQQQTYAAFTSPALTAIGINDAQCPPWDLWCITSGCAPGAAFRCRYVINYEFIPKENSIDILSANPSPCDAEEVELTEYWVASDEAVTPISTLEMSESPGAFIKEELPQDSGDTGFGMFYNVLQELLPVALEGLALVL